MGNAQQKLKRGWFNTDGRPGDRSIEQQLQGLDKFFAECKGKTVLDIGCAEGLISIEAARRGALAVHGVEVVTEHVKVGRGLVGDLPVTLENADANVWAPRRQYHYVLLLALLHKLRDPSAACLRFANACADTLVLRLPPANGHIIVDSRSGNRPFNLETTLKWAGFELVSSEFDGPFGELVAYWKRKQ